MAPPKVNADFNRMDGSNVDLQGYEGHDPFNDTDLPVRLDD